MTTKAHSQNCHTIAAYLKTSLGEAKRLYHLQNEDVLLAIGYGLTENLAIHVSKPGITHQEARDQYNQKMANKFKSENEIIGSTVTPRGLKMSIRNEDGYANFICGPSKIEYNKQGNNIGIGLLITDKPYAGQGCAKKALQEFLKLCDQNGYHVFLTPVKTEREVNLTRLKAFYASFGFANNPDREKEFWSTSDVSKHYAKRRLANPKPAIKNKPK